MTKEIRAEEQKIHMDPEERKQIELLYGTIVEEMARRFLPAHDIAILEKAYLFALKCHRDTRRKDGTLYITHPLETAKILADAGFESSLVAAAFLHDVVEDCGVTVEELEHEFGAMIAGIVDAISKVNDNFARDPSLTKEDLDVLSDVKFLTEATTKNNRRAFYIKLADRLHNLRTIEVFPVEQQKEKAAHTRNVLLPAAKMMKIFTLVDQLESLCLKIENPEVYEKICTAYQAMLHENRDTLEGENGLKQFMLNACLDESSLSKHVASVEFCERYPDSIFRNLMKEKDIHPAKSDFKNYINKKNVPLYNINLIVSDSYEGTAESILFNIYPILHNSRFGLTITGCGVTSESMARYYRMEDCFKNQFILFVEKEKDLLEYFYGVALSMDGEDDIRGHIYHINEAQPDEPQQAMMKVHCADGKMIYLPEGSTVIDMAAKLNSDIAICATGAYINGSNRKMPVYTRLREGDIVNIATDYKKGETYNPHASIRWVEYARSRQALKVLSRFLEKSIERGTAKVAVYDENKQEHEVEMGRTTVLDFCFASAGEKAPYLKEVYLNKSDVPVAFHTVLKYGDRVKFRYAEEETIDFEWLTILKTEDAKRMLADYFKKKYTRGAV